jgi:hypothetical protein
MLLMKMNVVGLPYPWVPHLQIQPTVDQKYLGKNTSVLNMCRLFFSPCHYSLSNAV